MFYQNLFSQGCVISCGKTDKRVEKIRVACRTSHGVLWIPWIWGCHRVTMKSILFLDVTSCNPIAQRRFGVTYCVHLQGLELSLLYHPCVTNKCGAFGRMRICRRNRSRRKPIQVPLCPPQSPHNLWSKPGSHKWISSYYCTFTATVLSMVHPHIQDVPGGKVGVLGGHSIGHSKQESVYVHVS
jgi:hypothetical protein